MGGDPEAERQYLTVGEVAAELRVVDETVRRWTRTGALAATAMDGRRAGLRIARADEERALCAGLDGPLVGVATPCFTCGGKTALVPSEDPGAMPSYRCTNPRCGATFRDVVIYGGLCDCGDACWLGPTLRGKHAPRSGLLVEAWGIAQCYICDKRFLYHWTRTSAESQITLIRWEGYTRRSLTRDGTALFINK